MNPMKTSSAMKPITITADMRAAFFRLIEITVREPATTHTVSLAQIRRWCDGVAVSPDELQKRKRVKDLIGGSADRAAR